MKKTAKILGGFGIAAALGVLTIPLGASAVTNDPTPYIESPDSADVTVQIIVTGETPSVTIEKPSDNENIVGLDIPVTTVYSDASRLVYRLIYVASDGTRTTYDLPEVPVATTGGTASGTHTMTIDASLYGGKYGDYILTSRADGAGSTTDSVAFKLISFDFVVKGTEENTGNPIVTVLESPGVYKTLFQVFDEAGNAIFDEPIELVLNEGATTDVTLPLAKYGVPTGNYKIVATPYDASGTIIDANRSRTIYYEVPEAPDVPNTGSIFGGLNLSKSDLVSTGLALLFVCAFFGIMIIVKHNKNSKSSKRRR
ncbi:MAG: hypothetical protein Q4E70_03195 [Candidatus Saccharibacteria bacterium]|nr:hypothetical protein [Candidatus Saccharibacteria bacterium]